MGGCRGSRSTIKERSETAEGRVAVTAEGVKTERSWGMSKALETAEWIAEREVTTIVVGAGGDTLRKEMTIEREREHGRRAIAAKAKEETESISEIAAVGEREAEHRVSEAEELQRPGLWDRLKGAVGGLVLYGLFVWVMMMVLCKLQDKWKR